MFRAKVLMLLSILCFRIPPMISVFDLARKSSGMAASWEDATVFRSSKSSFPRTRSAAFVRFSDVPNHAVVFRSLAIWRIMSRIPALSPSSTCSTAIAIRLMLSAIPFCHCLKVCPPSFCRKVESSCFMPMMVFWACWAAVMGSFASSIVPMIENACSV